MRIWLALALVPAIWRCSAAVEPSPVLDDIAAAIRRAIPTDKGGQLLIASPGTTVTPPKDQRNLEAALFWDLLDQIPNPGSALFFDSFLRVSDLYSGLLESGILFSSVNQTGNDQELHAARRLLYRSSFSATRPSAAYRQYLKLQETDFDLQSQLEQATDEKKKQRIRFLLERNLVQWELFGEKEEIEAAISTVIRHKSQAREIWWNQSHRTFKDTRISRSDGGKTPITLTDPPPLDWYSESGWVEASIVLPQAKVTLQYKRIKIVRPWIESSLLTLSKWPIRNTSRIALVRDSSGNIADSLNMPVEIIVFRKARFIPDAFKASMPILNVSNPELPALLGFVCMKLPPLYIESSGEFSSIPQVGLSQSDLLRCREALFKKIDSLEPK